MADQLYLRIMLGQGVMILAVVWVWAEKSKYPSIDDQIKKNLEVFDMLCKDGIIRGIIEHKCVVILDEDTEHVTKGFIEHWGISTTLKYTAKKDADFWDRVLIEVLKDPLFLGTRESRKNMLKEIKKDFNNGTLTDAEVKQVLKKVILATKEKTKEELKKFINYDRERNSLNLVEDRAHEKENLEEE